MDDSTTQNAGNGDGGDSGGDPNGWLTTFPEAQRGHEALTGYKTMKEFHEGHFNLWESNKANLAKVTELEGKLSNAVIKPTETDPEDVKTAYRQSLFKELGVPDKPEDYKLTKPTIPEGMPYDDAVEGWFKTILHENHVPNAEADKIFNGYMEMTGKYFQEASKMQKEATETKMADVDKVWGADAPLNKDLATRAVYALANLHKDIPGYAEWITKAAFDKNPFIYVMLADIGKANQNAPFVQGQGTPAQVKVGMNYDT